MSIYPFQFLCGWEVKKARKTRLFLSYYSANNLSMLTSLTLITKICVASSSSSSVGYDGAISIEHEDGLMSPEEGLEKAIAFLKDVLIFRQPGEMWWV